MRALRPLVLWAFLVAGFLVLYALVNGRGHGGAPALASHTPLIMAVVFPVVFVFVLVRQLRWAAVMNEGLALMTQGRYLQALDKMKAAPRRQPGVSAYYLGCANLLLWRLDEAQRCFELVRGGLSYRGVARLTPPRLALVCALRGNAEAAQRSLATVDQHGRRAAPEAILADAVLALRGGDRTAARSLLSRSELHTLGGPLRGLADALRAWASPQPMELSVAGLLCESDGAGLRSAWPELMAFVDEAANAS